MSPFQIPGLGQAKPNEVLPPLRTDAHVEVASAAGPVEQAQQPRQEPNGSAPSEAKEEQTRLYSENGVVLDHAQPESGAMVLDRPESPSHLTLQSDKPLQDLPADMHVDAAPAADLADQTEVPHQQAECSAPAEAEKPHNQLLPDGCVSQSQASPDGGPMAVDRPESPPSLTSALEAALQGLEEDTNMTQPDAQADAPSGPSELQPDQGDNPEWEVDSSPYESSSESSSSDSSDEDSDDEKYQLLGVEETARLLMEMEDGMDDEGDKGNKAAHAAPLRTKNELPEEVIPKPDVTITSDMKIEELGVVEHIVEGTILIKAASPGEYQVLDAGSVLCTENRVVIGVVAETFGKVLQPMYTVRFSSQDEMDGFGVQVGTQIFYPVDYALSVLTQPLRSQKFTDASNIHDEAVGTDEEEFSNDDKEAESKREAKYERSLNKKNKNRGPGDGAGGGRGPQPLRPDVSPNGELSYDDGPYKPLARPPGFGSGGAPGETVELPPRPQMQRGGGRRGGRRGRGGKGRDSDREGGRSGFTQPRDGHSLPPRGFQQPAPSQQAGNTWPTNSPPVLTPGAAPAMPAFGFNLPPSWPQQPPQQLAFGASSTLPPPPPPPPPPPGWPSQVPAQGNQGVNGTFVNPAFIAALMSQMQGQNGQQPPPPSGGWS